MERTWSVRLINPEKTRAFLYGPYPTEEIAARVVEVLQADWPEADVRKLDFPAVPRTEEEWDGE